ncbi:MAG: hypothetical protein KC729_00580 [Candidatus Eisenbacteria bacterium]|uniref:Uncharacterized protein n=1 Tax=Eiseniibacteriota bacterium TaxID=2212470 RepID=A0A956RM79_UNCEI|nr:hypothetical protein [Candidatus Eisenbacteria bacterium]
MNVSSTKTASQTTAVSSAPTKTAPNAKGSAPERASLGTPPTPQPHDRTSVVADGVLQSIHSPLFSSRLQHDATQLPAVPLPSSRSGWNGLGGLSLARRNDPIGLLPGSDASADASTGGSGDGSSAAGPGSPVAPTSGGTARAGNFSSGTQVQSSMNDVQRSDGSQEVSQRIEVRNEDGSVYREVTTHRSDGKGNSEETTVITHTAADGTVQTHTSTSTTSADGSSSSSSSESTTSGGGESAADDVPEDTGGGQDAGHTVNPGSPVGNLPYGGAGRSVDPSADPRGKDPRVTNPGPDGGATGEGAPIPRKSNGLVNPGDVPTGVDDARAQNLGDGRGLDPRVVNPANL